MKRTLSKTTSALVFFSLTLILSITGVFVMVSIYHPTYAVYATKLEDKPSNYFVLNNPDRYLLDAILNEHSSFFNSLDYTQIDELTNNHGTYNIEYNDDYYAIVMLYGDYFPPFMLPQALLAGIIISTIAMVIICLFKAIKYNKKIKK